MKGDESKYAPVIKRLREREEVPADMDPKDVVARLKARKVDKKYDNQAIAENAYKEVIMQKENLNTWPAGRDPWPKTPSEKEIARRVGLKITPDMKAGGVVSRKQKRQEKLTKDIVKNWKERKRTKQKTQREKLASGDFAIGRSTKTPMRIAKGGVVSHTDYRKGGLFYKGKK